MAEQLAPRTHSVTVVVPCYNEAGNVSEVLGRVQRVLATREIRHRILFIDNASTDSTYDELRRQASANPDLLLIRNSRNFGHIRSPLHGLLHAPGDAVIVLPADLQVPPEILPDLLSRWEQGAQVVLAMRSNSQEGWFFRRLRRSYYKIIRALADVQLLENTPGWGLYSRDAIEVIRSVQDCSLYLRGLVSELGFSVETVPYKELRRARGITKNNFYSLFDVAMLAMTSHSRVPLRLATMIGCGSAMLFAAMGVVYLLYKLVFWNEFLLGMAPVVIGLFFFASVQLFFLGIIGEYIGAIHSKVTRRPLVVERERINFPPSLGESSRL